MLAPRPLFYRHVNARARSHRMKFEFFVLLRAPGGDNFAARRKKWNDFNWRLLYALRFIDTNSPIPVGLPLWIIVFHDGPHAGRESR